jgi:hypothetical protein
MPEAGNLITVGSVIAAFGVAVLVFRIQRELYMESQGERSWVPWADRLLISATTAAFLLVIVPLISFTRTPIWALTLAAAGNSFAVLLLAGYPFAILAHYRRLWGKNRTGPRDNPEPAERYCVIGTGILAMIAFAGRILSLWDQFSK